MSETSGAGTINPLDRIKIGTVGTPAPGVEIRLAADGEVLIRGEVVMAGYRNLPEKTAEVLDADGWLATGDVGEIDADGYLRIVDRKKELIITAGGKNISPANLESALKAQTLIGQACVIGDQRPFMIPEPTIPTRLVIPAQLPVMETPQASDPQQYVAHGRRVGSVRPRWPPNTLPKARSRSSVAVSGVSTTRRWTAGSPS